MKHLITFQRLCLFLFALVLAASAGAQNNNEMIIGSKADWQKYCELVESGQVVNAKMTADIDLGKDIWIVGGTYSYYTSTFDGQGHTLTIDWTVDQLDQGQPFCLLGDGATIKNLRIKGKITSDNAPIAGLASVTEGNVTISNCINELDLVSGNNAPRSLSGMIRWIHNGKVTFNNCVVKGALTATTDDGKKEMGGFVGEQNGSCVLNNCLYVGTNNAGADSYTLARGATFNNCYYLHPCGEPQGTQAIEKELRNGEMTKKLHGNRTDKCYWAQVLGDVPNPYFDVDKSKTNYVYYDTANSRWACENFMLTDGQPLPIGIDFIAVKATYKCPFSNMRSATICLPYELPVQGFKGYTIADGGDNKVFFETVTDMLTAYTPYYIRADGTTPLGGTNLQVKAFKADKMTTPAAGYKFTGTVTGVDNATAAAANAYILQDDGKFHKVTTDYPAATIPAYRAYITYNGSNGAKQLSVVLDGQTTGIGDVTNEATDGKNGPVYDLQGRRVADRLDDATRHQLPAGVYIVGGRKIIVK